jgi:Aspartyl protease
VNITITGGLPYVQVSLFHQGRSLDLHSVILDTGSAGSVFDADEIARLGLYPAPSDPIRRVYGVGGSEFVFSKKVEALTLGALRVEDFIIQVGAMDYGFPLQGLIGVDFLLQAGAVIDLQKLAVRTASSS